MTPYIQQQLKKTSGKFLVSFEVPGPLPGTTEGFYEEMN